MTAPATTPATTTAPMVARAIALPRAGNEVFLDYIVDDRERRRVWVPRVGLAGWT